MLRAFGNNAVRRLPPIAALRALESAARHMSFTAAAKELHVSQSAISHQIKHLETLWGVALFIRLARGLELTPAGALLVQVVREFLQGLSGALLQLRGLDIGKTLRVQVPPSVALNWLVPRLPAFRAQHPDIEVWIATEMKDSSAFESGRLDVALQHGAEVDAAYVSVPLLREYVFPAASPRFLDAHGRPEGPADLCRYPLLLRTQDNAIAPQWEHWFRHAGVPETVYAPAIRHGVRFPNTSMTLAAALEGQGIALVRSAPVWDYLQTGRMVRLFNVRCPFPGVVHLVCQGDRLQCPTTAAFRDWIAGEAAASQAQFDAAESGSV